MARQLTIEDLDIVFNGDKRGRQYFIINTDGLRNFNVATLDATSPYAKIRMELGKDSEYQEVQKNFLTNVKTLFNSASTDANKNTYLTSVRENFWGTVNTGTPTKPVWATPILSDSPILTVANIRDFIITSKNLAATDKGISDNLIVDGSSAGESIAALDKYVARELKEAWKTYKIQKSTYDRKAIAARLDASRDIKALAAPFNIATLDKIVKSGDKYFRINAIDGTLNELSEDKQKCESYGLATGADCNEILYKCLIDPTADNLGKCVMKINDEMVTYGGTDDSNLRNMNPEIVLALLHRFGFKAIKDATGEKKIISVYRWSASILPELNISSGLITPQVANYLQKLVDYVNSKPEILNGKVTSNSFYDAGSNKDKFGKPVDPASSDKIALEGFARFYELRKSYAVNDVADLMRDLYARYDYNLPNYLQTGGASPYDALKVQLERGDAGAEYLDRIYKSLKSSLKNVDITDAEAAINGYIANLKAIEGDLLDYLEFVDKVNQTYNLFKYSPTKVDLSGANITDLNAKLATKIKEYKDKEDKVARFIQALAKKEISPLSENSVFDI
jgi:hypothetical protein